MNNELYLIVMYYGWEATTIQNLCLVHSEHKAEQLVFQLTTLSKFNIRFIFRLQSEFEESIKNLPRPNHNEEVRKQYNKMVEEKREQWIKDHYKLPPDLQTLTKFLPLENTCMLPNVNFYYSKLEVID